MGAKLPRLHAEFIKISPPVGSGVLITMDLV